MSTIASRRANRTPRYARRTKTITSSLARSYAPPCRCQDPPLSGNQAYRVSVSGVARDRSRRIVQGAPEGSNSTEGGPYRSSPLRAGILVVLFRSLGGQSFSARLGVKMNRADDSLDLPYGLVGPSCNLGLRGPGSKPRNCCRSWPLIPGMPRSPTDVILILGLPLEA
jgi:hypothetical protein